MIHLDEWQKEALEYKGNLLLCTGRRVGKTYIMARKAVERMLKERTNVIVVSLTEEQAMLIIATAKNILEEIGKANMRTKREHTNKTTITLKNGSKMISRPVGNDGDSLRGYEADILIIDEASRMGKLFWIAITPLILTTKGEMWLCSTPHGKQGYFWERFNEAYNNKDPEARFKVIYTSTEEVIKNRPISLTWTEEQRQSAMRMLEEEKRTMSQMEYGQEYMGLFLDEIRQFFSDELIQKACILQRNNTEGIRFMGVDIARMGGDRTSYQIIEVRKDHFYHKESIIKGKQDTYETEQQIIGLSETWNIEKIGLDAGSGSLGVGIYDRLMHNVKTKRKVVAMANQKVSMNRDGTEKQRIFKEDLYENLRYLLETGKLLLLDDADIKQDLRNVQIEYENGKTKIFSHPSADIVEGLTRGAWLAEKTKVNKVFITYI